MNERIKELAEQFRKEVENFSSENGFTYTEVFDEEKFAELIVKECTNIVLHYTDVDEGVAVAKKHFGVE